LFRWLKIKEQIRFLMFNLFQAEDRRSRGKFGRSWTCRRNIRIHTLSSSALTPKPLSLFERPTRSRESLFFWISIFDLWTPKKGLHFLPHKFRQWLRSQNAKKNFVNFFKQWFLNLHVIFLCHNIYHFNLLRICTILKSCYWMLVKKIDFQVKNFLQAYIGLNYNDNVKSV